MNRTVFSLLIVLLVITACTPAVTPAPATVTAPTAAAPTVISINPAPLQTRPPAKSAGSVTSQPTATLETNTFQPDPAVVNTNQAVEEVAKSIYDTLVADQDLKPYLKGVMTAFGVPPLSERDAALATTRLQQGLPLFFIPQLAEMADAYKDGSLISLDSFIAGANGRGAKQKGTDLPLTREYFTRIFAKYVGQARYQDTQVLPAFVLALGRERAKRTPPAKPDPLWGDGQLDPLQVTLLLYGVSYTGADSLATARQTTGFKSLSFVSGVESNFVPTFRTASLGDTDPIGDFVKGKIRGRVVSELQEEIGLPLDKKAAARASVCASLLLFGHKMQVTATPNLLYHKDGTKPWLTRVDLKLTFQDDYWSNYLPIDRWSIQNLFDCELPHRGPAVAQSLEWSVSDGLVGHGNFDIAAPNTNDDGIASATWKTVPETTPEDQRTFNNQRDAVGAIIVRAGGLVPNWPTLERTVNLLRDTGGVGNAPLTVIYYEPIGYTVDAPWEHQDTIRLQGTICSFTKPFTLKLTGRKINAGPYTGKVEFTPTDATSGNWMWTGSYSIPYSPDTVDSGGSTYQVTGLKENRPMIVLSAFEHQGSAPGIFSMTEHVPGYQFELKPNAAACKAE